MTKKATRHKKARKYTKKKQPTTREKLHRLCNERRELAEELTAINAEKRDLDAAIVKHFKSLGVKDTHEAGDLDSPKVYALYNRTRETLSKDLLTDALIDAGIQRKLIAKIINAATRTSTPWDEIRVVLPKEPKQ